MKKKCWLIKEDRSAESALLFYCQNPEKAYDNPIPLTRLTPARMEEESLEKGQ